MATRKKVEIFSAGCSACKETIEIVRRIASSHEVVVHDMNKSEIAARAKEYGIHRVPAVVIDGELASCCMNRGPEEKVLEAALA
jgi:glutaredoxin